MSQYVVKLSNGEDIVCYVHKNRDSSESSKLKISSPLKMESVARTTKKGIVESLQLCRWVQPYSDEEYFNIEKNSTIKDIRNELINYLDEKFNGNEGYKKIVNSSAFCSENNNIVSDNYKIKNNEKIAIIPPIGGG